MPEIEGEYDGGRKRKNESEGVYGDISIRDIVIYRHVMGRHFPDLSEDMRAWYEFMYFTAPVVGEKPYKGRSYEQHERAYKRGQQWIADYDRRAQDASPQALGDSGLTPLPFTPRAASH